MSSLSIGTLACIHVKIVFFAKRRAYSRIRINSQLSSLGVKGLVLEVSDFRVWGREGSQILSLGGDDPMVGGRFSRGQR